MEDRRGDERGYSLIELMVVVLVIGILIAVMLPTFVGARERASDRGTEAGLHNALVGAKTFYSDGETYTDFHLSASAIESSLVYVIDAPSLPRDGGRTVAIVQDSGDQLLLVGWSQSGRYLGLADDFPTGSSFCSSATLPTWATAADCNNGW
jgi:type IV pilus assembly protein PilA